MFKRGCCRKSRGCLQLLHELPCVECIEEVDVSGFSAEDFNGELSRFHKDSCGFLVRIASILKGQFFHTIGGLSVFTAAKILKK